MRTEAGHIEHPLPEEIAEAGRLQKQLNDDVWKRLQARLEPSFSRLEMLVSALFDRDLEPPEILEALELANAIATKMGTLGFAPAADFVRQARELLGSDEIGVTQAIMMASLLDDARTTTALAVSELSELEGNGIGLVVVGAISEAVDEILWLAISQGLAVSHHASMLTTQPEAETSDKPAQAAAATIVVVEDPDLSRSRPLIRSVCEAYPTQPLLLVTPPGNLVQRSKVVDSVTVIIETRTHPLEIIEETKRAVARAKHARSVAVFGAGGERLASQLNSRRLTAVVVDSVEDLVNRIKSGQTRAVVLAADTGTLEPAEILRMIRTDRQLRATVVIMVSETPTPSQRHSALRDGVDDVVASDIDPDDLAVLIKARLARRSVLEPVDDLSAVNGVLAWSAATVVMERMLTVSFRRNAAVGMAIVQFKQSSDPEQDLALDERIAGEFRQEDVVARVDKNHLVIALQGVNRDTMVRRLSQIHHKFSLHERKARSTAVEFPTDGRSLDELLENAELALFDAIDNNGPAVSAFYRKVNGPEAPDLLLVDPDQTLAGVLAATFDRRGLTVEQEPDAIDALSYLTGHSGRALPSLVLMDLDQRGIDGLQFLRQLKEAGTMARLKVVILSARASENDLRQAFELGVDDFVPKPFSTPLLLHRINRLLED